ncbi:hypothetical protein QRX60_17980 [Amycolatopsis mongoliensis]|uniref:Uncharacterized protein n=1 Tax=Amycolatopsis mongoliensis TaxID=715475 RepID=A0A9Y2JZ56_9PSEU|nr:hypothetical protein [Amycolatopsis sp. 4-36]WIY05644.1 hypothetical protein QRX60_17980 [Amycolatopsis sp. 4-36]
MNDVLWPFTTIGCVLLALGLAIAITVVAGRRDARTEGTVGLTIGIFKLDAPARIVLALFLVLLGFASIVFSFFHTEIESRFEAEGKAGQSELPRWDGRPTVPTFPSATSSPQPAPTPETSSPSTPPPAPPITPTRSHLSPVGPQDFVTTTVRTAGGEAAVYVGKRAAIMDTLRGLVTFNVDPGPARDEPDMCVETAVSSGYSGSNVTLVAGDLGVGWPAAEAAPSPRPEGSAGSVHQQMVGLPSGATVGSWPMSIHLEENGTSRTLGTVTISHERADDGSVRWGINGEGTACT